MDNKILFCKVSYMKYYEGHEVELQRSFDGGKYLKGIEFGAEEYNFVNYDGKCYGSIHNPGKLNLERLEASAQNNDFINDVTIVWCAATEKEMLIVGWYEHATLLRQEANILGILPMKYGCYTNAENAYLLPEQERTFEVPREATDGKGKGFGKLNYWYAESEWAQTEFVPKVKAFIAAHRKNRINCIPQNYLSGSDDAEAIKDSDDKMEKYLDEKDIMAYLPLAYKTFNHDKDMELALKIADVLAGKYQYTMALEWYSKAKSLASFDDDQFQILLGMATLYCKQAEYDKAFECIDKALEIDNNVYAQCDVKRTEAEIYWAMAKKDDALACIDYVINNEKDRIVVAECRQKRASWLTTENNK